jgi:hypothetical protein
MDQGRSSDAVAVASKCYAAIRNELLERHPVYVDLGEFFHNFVLWAEIVGNVYAETQQKYMAIHVYETTLFDMETLACDSPKTQLHSLEHEYFKSVFKRKLERLRANDSDEDDSYDDSESTISPSKRFRLAHILPSPNISAPIQCTVLTIGFATAPPYESLSYVWGGSRMVISYTRSDGPIYEADDGDAMTASLRTILVNDVEKTVRPNLFAGMQHLRQHQSPVTVWIDALCMDGEDMQRRGEWAIRMRDIYKKAEEVIVWLGPGDEHTDKAMIFLTEFWELTPTLHGGEGEYLFGASATVPWTEICDLLQRNWWKRIWTLQEFCVAQRLSIHCGIHSIPWSYLQEFTTFVDLKSETYRFPRHENSLRKVIDFVKEQHVYIFLVDEFRMDYGFSLDKLFHITEQCESYHPRDKIFALLGLLDQKSAQIAPKLNYRYSPCAVYSDMIVYMQVKNYADDRPIVEAKSATALSDLRDHLALCPAEKIDSKCDGERCGRRLMCFTNRFPKKERTDREHFEVLRKEYESYSSMHQIQQFLELLLKLHS